MIESNQTLPLIEHSQLDYLMNLNSQESH